MATGKCFSLVGGRALRVTRLDACGRPQYGDCASAVSDGFVSITFTADIDDGDEIDVKNANGKTCVKQPACPTLKGYGIEINFCRVDPDLFAMLSGQEPVLSAQDGSAIGFRVSTHVDACDKGFALEVWSNVPGVKCDEGGDKAYGYLLLPFLQGGVFGDFTIENDAVSFTMANAHTMDGSTWGNGPYDVVSDAGGAPGPLTDPIGDGDHLHLQLTEVPPPDAGCGCIAVDDPNAPAATGATEGSPGTWTPQPSNRPDTLADMTGVTASPTTAWGANSYVVTESGEQVTWDGTNWVAYTTP